MSARELFELLQNLSVPEGQTLRYIVLWPAIVRQRLIGAAQIVDDPAGHVSGVKKSG